MVGWIFVGARVNWRNICTSGIFIFGKEGVFLELGVLILVFQGKCISNAILLLKVTEPATEYDERTNA